MKEALLYTLFICFTLMYITLVHKSDLQNDSELSLTQKIELVDINRNLTLKINFSPKKLLPALNFYNIIKPNLCEDATNQTEIFSPTILKVHQARFFDIRSFLKSQHRLVLHYSEDKQDSHNLS